MSLTTHGRYPYRAIVGRPNWRWPDGSGLAVYIALNIEHFPFGEGAGIALAPAQPEPDIVNYTWRDYGNRFGVWRLLAEFDRLGLPAAALANAAIYDHAPELMGAFRARGDEVVGHGISNADCRQGALGEAGEARLIAETTAILAHHEGRPPAGWLGPWVSESRVTPDLLAEAGYRYVMDWAADDQPVWLATRGGGRILAIPYARPSNDLPVLHGAAQTPRQFAELLIDQFDEMLGQSASAPLVFNLSLHPFLAGWPFRLRALRAVFEHIAAHRDRVWLTRPGEIAAFAETLPAGHIA
jgi:peptidoglycan/xylan/chitin deacetylase (PgdA/CDA1 family)